MLHVLFFWNSFSHISLQIAISIFLRAHNIRNFMVLQPPSPTLKLKTPHPTFDAILLQHDWPRGIIRPADKSEWYGAIILPYKIQQTLYVHIIFQLFSAAQNNRPDYQYGYYRNLILGNF